MRFVMSCVSLCLVLATSPSFSKGDSAVTDNTLSEPQNIAQKKGGSFVVIETDDSCTRACSGCFGAKRFIKASLTFPSIEGEDFAEPTFLDTLKQRSGKVAWGEHGKTFALETGKFLGHSAAIVGSSAFNLVWRTLCVGGRFVKDTLDLFVLQKINPPQCLDGRWSFFGKYEPLSWSPQPMPDDVEFLDEAVNALKIGVVSLGPLACLVLNTLNVVGETACNLVGDVYRAFTYGEVAKPTWIKQLFSAEARTP